MNIPMELYKIRRGQYVTGAWNKMLPSQRSKNIQAIASWDKNGDEESFKKLTGESFEEADKSTREWQRHIDKVLNNR